MIEQPSGLIFGDELVRDEAGVVSSGERSARARQVAERWLFSDSMRGLLAVFDADLDQLPGGSSAGVSGWLHFKEELPPWIDGVLDGSLEVSPDAGKAVDALRRALGLEQWAAGRFNFRSQDGATYKERNQAVSGGFDETTQSRVAAQAAALELVHSTRPRYDKYDCTLVLGGGWRSPLLRPRYAALWERNGISLGSPYFLGSPRFLVTDPPEREKTDSYAPGAIDEFDLMVAGASTAFELRAVEVTLLCGCATMDGVCPRWQHAGTDLAAGTPPRYTHERSAALLDRDNHQRGDVLSASTGRPPYRPDTTDTLALWARQARPQAGQRVLVVTTQVFVPFQTFDSLKRLYLDHGVDIDVIGYSAEWGDREETAEYLLQETLSAIRSARRLLVEAVGMLTGH